MKNYLLFLFFNLLMVPLTFSQPFLVKSYTDTITESESLVFETQAILWDWNGGTQCHSLFSQTDTLKGDTLFYDLTHTIWGYSMNYCTRYDTINVRPLPAGNYTLVCFQTLIDTTNINSFSPRAISDTISFHVSGITSLNEEDSREQFSVFPNPVKNQLQLKGNWLGIEQLELFSMQGKLIRKVERGVTQISLSNLPPGIYFLQATREGKREQFKFVKE